jgi:hypothetical protein
MGRLNWTRIITVAWMLLIGWVRPGTAGDTDSLAVAPNDSQTTQSTEAHKLPDQGERAKLLGLVLLIAGGFFVIVYQQKRRADNEASST